MVVKMAILNLRSHTSTVSLPLAVFVYGQKRILVGAAEIAVQRPLVVFVYGQKHKLVGAAEIAVQRRKKGGIVQSFRSRSSSSQISVRRSGSWQLLKTAINLQSP
jgi:hypothetical protein